MSLGKAILHELRVGEYDGRKNGKTLTSEYWRSYKCEMQLNKIVMSTGNRFSYKRSIKLIFVVFLILGPTPLAIASASDTVIFGVQSWPGVTVKTEIASQILQKIGYQTKILKGSTSEIYSSMMKNGTNQADISLAMWQPSENKKMNRSINSGKVKKLSVNILHARYGLAVPRYVWNTGIHSIADLRQNAQRFNKHIYGIKSGKSVKNIMEKKILRMEKTIKRNGGALKGWRVVPGSTATMMAYVDHAIARHEWVVFTAWSPNWMNIEYEIKYLKDPEGILGKNGKIVTLANTEFINSHPNVAHFLRQFIVSAKTESQWIYHLNVKKQSKSLVADSWIRNHMPMVRKWLNGVKTANGQRSAISVWN